MSLPQVNIIIPTIGKDRMVVDLLQQIHEMDDDTVRQVIVFDNGMDDATRDLCNFFSGVRVINAYDKNIYEMWNMGVKEIIATHPNDYIAILNDDLLLISDKFFTKLVEPLDMMDDVWATCGNYDVAGYAAGGYRDIDDFYRYTTGTFKDGGFAGFCFAVKGEAYLNRLPLFDTSFHIWYGDDDLVHNIHKLGKQTVMANLAIVEHINGGSNTFGDRCRLQNDENAKDTEIYMKKWHVHS